MPLHEPLADHREADHRERALTEAARQRDGDRQRPERLRAAHHADDHAEPGDDRGQHDARAETIDETADPDREQRSDQRRPQIELRVLDAADLQIRDQRLGHQAEALRPARQGADHGRRREQQHDPSVIHAAHCRL